MKTQVSTILSILGIFLITSIPGFAQENKVDLHNSETQNQVFREIINDPQLMENFIVKLKANEMALYMVMEEIVMACNMDASTCKSMSEMMAEHAIILESLGKVLDENAESEYTVQKRPRHKHR